MEKQSRKFELADILPQYTLADILESEAIIKANVAVIDAGLERLSLRIGRKLTEDEQGIILDIVDEYTPKDEDGNYLCPLISFGYAWQIYRLKKLHQ